VIDLSQASTGSVHEESMENQLNDESSLANKCQSSSSGNSSQQILNNSNKITDLATDKVSPVVPQNVLFLTKYSEALLILQYLQWYPGRPSISQDVPYLGSPLNTKYPGIPSISQDVPTQVVLLILQYYGTAQR